ncbi:hypothetical protein ACPCUK_03330 [Streptomyces arboris]|uniref:hypothetical protein n=1 Tax=Streptomyces arboris TaxID=2600619 RepID=UPI003C2D82E4
MDDSLSFESFFEGAKKAAHRAMDDHGRSEHEEFALHAGVAVEKLAKAVLVSKNPLYIAEIRNADMMLHLGGHLQLPAEKVRTAGAKDAIARLRRIGVLPQQDPQLDLLIEMRNGAAHATPDSTLAKGMVSPLARTIETLLDDLGRPLAEFWERWTDAVRNAVNEQEDQVLRDVQLRIIQAKHAFDDRFAGLPPEIREQLLKSPQPRAEEHWIREMQIWDHDLVVLKTGSGTCPACGGEGLLTFKPVVPTPGATTFKATGFGCYLCSFEVSGSDELAALRQTHLPNLMDSMTVTHGRTSPPEDLEMGEPQAG